MNVKLLEWGTAIQYVKSEIEKSAVKQKAKYSKIYTLARIFLETAVHYESPDTERIV